jgi:hypothetical protein
MPTATPHTARAYDRQANALASYYRASIPTLVRPPMSSGFQPRSARERQRWRVAEWVRRSPYRYRGRSWSQPQLSLLETILRLRKGLPSFYRR